VGVDTHLGDINLPAPFGSDRQYGFGRDLRRCGLERFPEVKSPPRCAMSV